MPPTPSVIFWTSCNSFPFISDGHLTHLSFRTTSVIMTGDLSIHTMAHPPCWLLSSSAQVIVSPTHLSHPFMWSLLRFFFFIIRNCATCRISTSNFELAVHPSSNFMLIFHLQQFFSPTEFSITLLSFLWIATALCPNFPLYPAQISWCTTQIIAFIIFYFIFYNFFTLVCPPKSTATWQNSLWMLCYESLHV